MASTVLTRTVIRRILANQPIRHHDISSNCRSAQRVLAQGRYCGPHIQSRSIFAMLSPSTNPPVYNLSKKEMDLRKHVKALQEAFMLISVKSRVGSKADLEKSFKAFFVENDEAQELITDHQAGTLVKIFNFLMSSDQGDPSMSVETARAALESISHFEHGRPDSGMLKDNPPLADQYWVLVKQLVEYIQRQDPHADRAALASLELCCFANSGHADLIEHRMQVIDDIGLWKTYVKSQFSEPSTMKDTLRAFQEKGLEPDDELTSLFVEGFIRARQSDLARRLLHGSGILKNAQAALSPAAGILAACNDFNDSPTATEIIAKVDQWMESVNAGALDSRGSQAWTVQLLRHRVTGRQPANVIDILQEMLSDPQEPLSIAVINQLVSDAYNKNDSELGKAIIDFAQRHDAQYNGYTFLPQVLYKLRNDDLDGALATWDYILYDLEPLRPTDMAETMEELLRGILTAHAFRSDQFDEILENHSKYARRFRPETVAILVEFYLRNEEFESAALLMRKHAPGFSTAARSYMLARVMNICRDPAVTNECVWNVYNMVSALFEETSRTMRDDILAVALQRHMNDKALEMFRNSRDHWQKAFQPDEDTYLLALSGFEGIWPAVQTVHNSLKVDMNVELSARLLNALMRAYTRCGQDEAQSAVEFWDEILDINPDLDQDSVINVFEACTVSPVGLEQAQHVWKTLKDRAYHITDPVYGAYFSNLVLSAPEQDHSQSLDQATDKYRLRQSEVLQGAYASAIDDSQKIQIARWMEVHRPEFWSSPQAQNIILQANELRQKLNDAEFEFE